MTTLAPSVTSEVTFSVTVVPSPRVRSSTTTSAGAAPDAARQSRYDTTVLPEKTMVCPSRAHAASSPRRTDS
jgi:hypothetical protein